MPGERLSGWWKSLQARERRGILAAASVVAAALLIQLAWTTQAERTRLRRQVPQLRAELAAMQAQSREWQQMQAQPRPPEAAAGAGLEAAVRAGAGSVSERLSVRLTGDRQIAVQGEVAFDRWLEWVAQLHATHRLRLARCEIQRLAAAGRVRVDAEFSGEQ